MFAKIFAVAVTVAVILFCFLMIGGSVIKELWNLYHTDDYMEDEWYAD